MVPVSNAEAKSLRPRTSELGTLVIQTAHLGDVVLTLPLLIRLAEVHGPVDVVTTLAAAPLAGHHPAVRRVIPFDKHGADRGLRGLMRVGRALRSIGYARAILPHGSVRSASLAWLSGAGERTGFAGAPGAPAYTRQVPKPMAGHMSSRLIALSGAATAPARPWLSLTAEDRAEAAAWLSAHRIATPFIVLAPGSRWGTKRWPQFRELAMALPHPIVVIGGPEDGHLAQAIVAAAPGRAQSAAGELGLRASAALVDRAALLISNDSVALHFATALERPLVAIFGPTVPSFGFGPLGDEPVLQHDALSCRPCSAHGPPSCPLVHHRCMTELGVARVAAAAMARLARDA
ncbi:MAG: lipopolysaccharide heptosyltransferase II [Gemmatimonadota bacterium]